MFQLPSSGNGLSYLQGQTVVSDDGLLRDDGFASGKLSSSSVRNGVRGRSACHAA